MHSKGSLGAAARTIISGFPPTTIVIATPVYNYNMPAALKAWIDHIVRKGLTLGKDGSGPVTGKKATVLLASGGVCT